MSLYDLKTERQSNPVDLIEFVADTNDWSFERSADDELALTVEGKWADYRVSFAWMEEFEAVHLSCAFDLKIPDSRIVEVIKLIAELEQLVESFRTKGDAYLELVKMGRTEMQDAVPMTVGQEFHAFAAALEGEIQLLRESERWLCSVNMGATAIGTGINVPAGYPEACAAQLAKLTGKP